MDMSEMQVVLGAHGVATAIGADGSLLALERWSNGLHIWLSVAGWDAARLMEWLGY